MKRIMGKLIVLFFIIAGSFPIFSTAHSQSWTDLWLDQQGIYYDAPRGHTEFRGTQLAGCGPDAACVLTGSAGLFDELALQYAKTLTVPIVQGALIEAGKEVAMQAVAPAVIGRLWNIGRGIASMSVVRLRHLSLPVLGGEATAKLLGGGRARLIFTGATRGEGSAGTIFHAYLETAPGVRREVAVKFYPDAYMPSLRKGPLATLKRIKELEGRASYEARMLEDLQGMGRIEFHGTVRVGGRKGSITNLVSEGDVARGELPVSALSPAQQTRLRSELERFFADAYKKRIAPMDEQWGVGLNGELEIFDVGSYGRFKQGVSPESLNQTLERVLRGFNVPASAMGAAAVAGFGYQRSAGASTCHGFTCKPR